MNNSFLYPPQNAVLGGYTVLSLSVILWFRHSEIIFLWFCSVTLVPTARFCSNFHHTLAIRHCMFYRKIGAEGSVLQEFMPLCNFNCKMFLCSFFLWFSYVSLVAIASILFKFSPHLNHHTLHVLLEKKGWRVSIARVMPLCNLNCKMFTIVLIVHVLWNQLLLQLPVYPFNTLQICYTHTVDVHEEIICRKKYFWQIYNIFNLANFYYSTCSAYFVKSTPPRAFIVSFWFFAGML